MVDLFAVHARLLPSPRFNEGTGDDNDDYGAEFKDERRR